MKQISIKNIFIASLLFSLPILANAQQKRLSENENLLDDIKARYPQAFDAYGKVFYKDISYQKANVEGTVNFAGYRFTRDVRFLQCTFGKTVNFSKTNFGKVVDLSRSTFKAGIDFTGARLPRKLILKNLKLEGNNDTLDLTKAVLTDEVCEIDLQGTDISKIKLDYRLGFKLLFSDDGKIEFTKQQKKEIFQDLLAQQKRLGFQWSCEKILKEFARYYPNETQLVSDEMPPEVLPENILESERQVDSLLKALGEVEQAIERESANRPSNGLAEGFLIIAFVAGFFILLIKQMDTYAVKSTLLTRKNAHQKKVTAPAPKKPKQKQLNRLQKNVVAGDALWKRYEAPESVLNEPEKFWQHYEQLLQKVKKRG